MNKPISIKQVSGLGLVNNVSSHNKDKWENIIFLQYSRFYKCEGSVIKTNGYISKVDQKMGIRIILYLFSQEIITLSYPSERGR